MHWKTGIHWRWKQCFVLHFSLKLQIFSIHISEPLIMTGTRVPSSSLETSGHLRFWQLRGNSSVTYQNCLFCWPSVNPVEFPNSFHCWELKQEGQHWGKIYQTKPRPDHYFQQHPWLKKTEPTAMIHSFNSFMTHYHSYFISNSLELNSYYISGKTPTTFCKSKTGPNVVDSQKSHNSNKQTRKKVCQCIIFTFT